MIETSLHQLGDEIRSFIHDCVRLQEQAFSGTIRELRESLDTLKAEVLDIKEEVRGMKNMSGRNEQERDQGPGAGRYASNLSAVNRTSRGFDM
jgi:chromosome condensin MukBEF complex kleisin-like MukF subunit